MGTDLFLLARDNRLFDVGLVVGAQVKTGRSFFRAPESDKDGAVVGWWYLDGRRKHIDYWLGHALPHLLVLHDPDTKISYWVHVTPEAVVPTRVGHRTAKGAKILVPKANTVSVECRDALLAVAATLRPPSPWEGSAWTGARDLAPADQLRHALVVPRLVAPHRNTGVSRPITAAQMVALLTELRLHDVERFAEAHEEVPDPDTAGQVEDWTWRFAGAFTHRIRTGSADQLLGLVEDAPDPPSRSAAAVAAAAALLEQTRAREARQLLDDVLARDDNLPVDHAWLRVQHARACIELGDLHGARSSAVEAQQARLTNADDPTATAIAGVAAILLFRTADLRTGDVGQAVSGMDTLAFWWRYQRIATGAISVIEREFSEWAVEGPRRVALIDTDPGDGRLVGACLLASHAGDQPGWRALQSLYHRQELLRTDRGTDPAEVCDLLCGLWLSGDHKAVESAVLRFVSDGPAIAVRSVAALIDFGRLTSTTTMATLTLLRLAGDLLDQGTANRALRWLLSNLNAPTSTADSRYPRRPPEREFVRAISSVLQAASSGEQKAVVQGFVVREQPPDLGLAEAWRDAISRLPASAWADQPAELIRTIAAGQPNALRLLLLRIAAIELGDATAHDLLFGEIGTNPVGVLMAAGRFRALPDAAASELVDGLESRVRDEIENARAGSHGFGGADLGELLTKANLVYPEHARWDTVLELLAEDRVLSSKKSGVCAVLSWAVDELDGPVRECLAEIIPGVLAQPTWFDDQLTGQPSAHGAAAQLAASLSEDRAEIERLLGDLLAGGRDQQVWAAHLVLTLGAPTAAGMLAVLSRAAHPAIRASAAAGLARVVAATGDHLAQVALHQCLRDTGTKVPKAILDGLSGVDRAALPVDVLTELSSHCSARVRSEAMRLLGNLS